MRQGEAKRNPHVENSNIYSWCVYILIRCKSKDCVLVPASAVGLPSGSLACIVNILKAPAFTI